VGIKIITKNRKAFHDYHVLDKYESGIQLMGSEVKSIRAGTIQLKDSYVIFKGSELYLINVHIGPYQASSYMNHEPERQRKLLLHRGEMDKLISLLKERGVTIIPLQVYFKEGIVKVEIAVVKGKQQHDKRQDLKTRDAKRELDQLKRK
jgi:SsrA-binding protein